MISGTDLHQFDVHNNSYSSYLPLNYVDGVILEMAVPRMPYEQLAEFLEEKCGCYFQGLYYQVLNQDLERGLVRVSNDRSTSHMFDVKETFGRLTLYLDHLDINLLEYLSQAITYNMDDLAEMEVKTDGVEARTSTTEGVEARNSTTEGVEANTNVVETRRCTVEVDTETEYESDDDSDYQSDKSVDYLSPGEDELIELRNRMKAYKKAKTKAKDKPDSEMNEPNEENNMHADNVTESIRVFVLERMNKMREISKKWNHRIKSEGFTVDEGKRTCSYRMWQLSGLPCVHATKWTRGGAIGSRGRGGRGDGGAIGSITRVANRFGGASRSRGRGKKKVRTSGFAKWFRLQDEPEESEDELKKTQAEPWQTQHELEQTQVEDQVEQTKDQAKINLTKVEQTQEQTQE
nr:peroxidase 20 [Tanacetum cinerariifolium]